MNIVAIATAICATRNRQENQDDRQPPDVVCYKYTEKQEKIFSYIGMSVVLLVSVIFYVCVK